MRLFPTIQKSHSWSSTSWCINPIFRGRKLCRCDPCIFSENTTTHKWAKFILGEWNNLILCMYVHRYIQHIHRYYISVVLKFHGGGQLRGKNNWKGFLDWGGGMKQRLRKTDVIKCHTQNTSSFLSPALIHSYLNI